MAWTSVTWTAWPGLPHATWSLGLATLLVQHASCAVRHLTPTCAATWGEVQEDDQHALVADDDAVAQTWRDFWGVGMLMGGATLPPLQTLPIFVDLKIANDAALPGLTEQTLPIAQTAIFVGWLVSALLLNRVMEVFGKEQLLVAHVLGFLLVFPCTVVVPYLTAGNLVVFTLLRFAHGLLLNFTALQSIYVQERMPPGRKNQALVANNIFYCLTAIAMAASCRDLTQHMDWRIEVLLWCCLPPTLGVLVAWPQWWNILTSLPAAARRALFAKQTGKVAVVPLPSPESEVLPEPQKRQLLALSICFLACGMGFYGLNYSAGQLSPDIYLSCMLLHGADILGYLFALTTDFLGRNTVQGCCFGAAGLCLLLCSTGELGSAAPL
ncbi:unnamed protein product [Durusdinium trenchii]|uniref:Uncharacterized protein n=2 Tax=Durusdinium trenchii TaxID=1381693 RepID=A0ABP0REI6_9DINO